MGGNLNLLGKMGGMEIGFDGGQLLLLAQSSSVHLTQEGKSSVVSFDE